MSLKQKVLGIVAGGMTLASLSGVPAYASRTNSKPAFEGSKVEFADVDNDGLKDMIVASDSSVTYLKGDKDGSFKYKQKIYTSRDRRRPKIILLTADGKVDLMIMSDSEFKTYKFRNGRFEEYLSFPMWIEDDEEEIKKAPDNSI